MKTPALVSLLGLAFVPLTQDAAGQTAAGPPFRLIVLDPGHFHAALLQKSMHRQIDPTVSVYAPDGDDVRAYLKRVDAYNTRPEDPTTWKMVTHTSADYFPRMLADKPGNVVVLSGRNREKPARLISILEAGMHVFADKPMVIEPGGFELLKQAFATARERGVILYDIMTERSEITNLLLRGFAQQRAMFGQLAMGTLENPAVVMESVHHFHKSVSGSPLIRPAWFFDVTQSGEGLTDVGTHLVDLVPWICFPDQSIDIAADIEILSARRWPTPLTAAQFQSVTGLGSFPDTLKDSVKDGMLNVFANTEVNYRIKGVHVRVIARWDYEAPAGTGDTHHAVVRGTKCNLVIRQGAAENHRSTLYLEAATGTDPIGFRRTLMPALLDIQQQFPGVDVKPLATSWQVVVPPKYDIGHEAHFAAVTERFLRYLAARKLPVWEEPNMLAKYYITTKAVELARQNR